MILLTINYIKVDIVNFNYCYCFFCFFSCNSLYTNNLVSFGYVCIYHYHLNIASLVYY